jgi:thiosulfate/3-mercaptopyruvate sulfurtransferase
VFAPMEPLLAPSRLAELLADPDPALRPVVLDVRWRLGGAPARPDHDAAHIPGAVFLDMDTDLADPPGPAGRHPLPSVERLQSALRRAGVRDESLVVAHDDAQGVQAARAWWLLRWAGFAAGRVAVLDGGYRGWVDAGLPTTAEPSRPAPGDVTVRPGGMPVLDADEAAALAGSGVLLDARAPERYRGEHEPVDPKAGHIPGARNAPATDVLGPHGGWREPASLAEWLKGLADGADGEVGAYCGSGATAAALVLAAEHAGLRPPERPIALYVGSWSNWSADPGRPVATGAEP